MTGERGPKSLPAQIHQLRGNPSKLPLARMHDRVVPETVIPEAPEHLISEAKSEWNRISAELYKLGMVSEIDRVALAIYCQAYGRWQRVEMEINKLQEEADQKNATAGLIDETKNGYKQISALMVASKIFVEQMNKYIPEFGMTPSARNGLMPGLPGKQQGDLFDQNENTNETETTGAAEKSTERFFPSQK